MEMDPIRTALFVPGSRQDRFLKALDTGADKIIIDLEDEITQGTLLTHDGQVLNEMDLLSLTFCLI